MWLLCDRDAVSVSAGVQGRRKNIISIAADPKVLGAEHKFETLTHEARYRSADRIRASASHRHTRNIGGRCPRSARNRAVLPLWLSTYLHQVRPAARNPG